MRKCKYLSNPIYIDPDNIKPYIDEQYDFFMDSFVNNKTYFAGLPIIVEHEKDFLNYGELLNNDKYKATCFAHIVSKQVNQNVSDRILDLQRLKTCKWVKELIDLANNQTSNCNNCQYQKLKLLIEKNNNITYIFCQNVRYVVVLQEIHSRQNNYYIIKTAFYVNEEYSYRNLMRKLS